MNSNKIIKRNPIRDLERLERNFFNEAFFPSLLWQKNNWEVFLMRSHLNEDENNYYLKVELPGVNKESIKIDAGEKYLHIHGEKKEEVEKESVHCHYSELTYGSFSREYNFSVPVDKESIEAKYQNGILNLTIPKITKSKLTQIKIEADTGK